LADSSADVQNLPPDPVAGLIDIPLPQQIGLWPATWPARIAVTLLFVAAVVAVWQFARRRRANRYRREALAELKQIERMPRGTASLEIAARLSLLVRRTALAAFSRARVAPLAGEEWLAFLDRSLDGTGFSDGVGRLLASAPYAPIPPGERELAALIELTGRWIRRHHV
jgi:Ca-activated chloride channel family protein